MQARDLRAHHLFAHVQRLIDGFEVERKARRAAEAADKAKSELLATINQELRTPMEAVVAMADLLLATPLDETQQRHAETLLQSSRSLLNVLNDVLDFSRLETGRFEADPIAFDLHGLVHEVAAESQARANDKGLTGSFYISANCPRLVICKRRAAAPSADRADREFAEIHLDRLGAPACKRRRTMADGFSGSMSSLEQGGAGSPVPALHRDQQLFG